MAISMTRARRAALLVLCAGQFMIILDGTIVNVALGHIQRDLGFTAAGLAWVVNAYLVAAGGLLLLAGRLGDLIGRARMFSLGLVLFTAASLAAGLATDPAVLVVARFVQGVGAAGTAAVTLGMIVAMSPEPAARARAIGVYSFVQSAGGSLGLLAGGVITETLGWHWVFLVNIPIGVATLLLARRLVPADTGTRPHGGADIAGAFLVTGALMLGVYTIVGSGDHTWPHNLGVGAVAVALLAGFIARQATARNPLMPLRLFASRVPATANITQFLMVAGIFAFQFLGALYLQRVGGYDPARTGLAIMPLSIAIGVLSLGASARLIGRFGARAVLIAGLGLMAAGMALLSQLPVHGGYPAHVLPALLLLGVGFGAAMPAVASLAMSAAGQHDSGLASGLSNTMVQVGGALGLAVAVSIAAARTATLTGAGSPAAALTGGYRLAFTLGTGLLVVAIGVAATLPRRPRAPRPASAPGPVAAGRR